MFNIGFLTLDVIIILVIFAGLFFWSITFGKKVLAKFILSFYPSILIFENLPYIKLESSLSKISAFIVLYIIIYFLLGKNFNAKNTYQTTRKTIDGIILSIASVIMLLTVYYYILPIENFYSFTLPFSSLFTATLPLGVWLVIPLIALIVTNKGD